MRHWAAFIAVSTILSLSGCHYTHHRSITLPAAPSTGSEPSRAPEIERITSATPAWVDRGHLGARLWSVEQQFYEKREYLPAWHEGGRPAPALEALVRAIADAGRHGLDSRDYGSLDPGPGAVPADLPELDVRATYAFLKYAADLLGWSTSPRDIDPNWIATPVEADLSAHLRLALEQNRVAETLEAFAPTHPQYKGLQAALDRAGSGAAEANDAAAAWRTEMIRMNLQRWRWLPRDLGENYVMVNVPAYVMQVIEHGRTAVSMRVIVGKTDTPTPLFSDELTYVVFSPYWNIPAKILREETVPHAIKDPGYLTRNGFQVVGTSGSSEPVDPSAIDWSDPEATRGLRIRQEPGPGNSLGLVKFLFPNQFDVYLHDTPNDRLFNREKRTLSHGCVRIENPAELARYVLRESPAWTAPRIEAAMASGQEQSAVLKTPLPVHITYFTTWVGPGGTVAFLDDPYGLDLRQAKGSSPQRSDSEFRPLNRTTQGL